MSQGLSQFRNLDEYHAVQNWIRAVALLAAEREVRAIESELLLLNTLLAIGALVIAAGITKAALTGLLSAGILFLAGVLLVGFSLIFSWAFKRDRKIEINERADKIVRSAVDNLPDLTVEGKIQLYQAISKYPAYTDILSPTLRAWPFWEVAEAVRRNKK